MSEAAPEAEAFARVPVGWFVFGPVPVGRPVTRRMPWGEVVAWRGPTGIVAHEARCAHLGADLGGGELIDGCLACPFHGWRYGPDGGCVTHPELRLRRFAIEEVDGRVFVAPTAEPPHPVPRFDAGGPLASAPPFSFDLACPWWMVSANGFDAAHFGVAHDRRPVGEPEASHPHPAAHRVRATFEVTGTGWRDRATRVFAGGRVTLDATVWAGTLALVESRFRRSRTFGLVEIRPLFGDGGPPAAHAPATRVTVWIHVAAGPGAPALARVRAGFVRAFLAPDADLLQGALYRPDRLTPEDALLARHFRWLAPASHATPTP